MTSVALEAWFPSSLRELLRMRSVAKLSRLKRRILSPQRIALTVIAVLLSTFWVGQTLLGIVLRPPADPQRLRAWITGGLVLYAFWHLVRSVWTKDLQGVAWSRSERELLWTAPLSPSQLMTYRLAGIIGPAMLKAALLTIVLWPDSSRLELTFLGLMIALAVLELTRMIVEIGCAGLSSAGSIRVRIGVSSIAVAIAASIACSVWQNWNPHAKVPAIELPNLMLGGLVDLSHGPVARLIGYPLSFVAELATAGRWSASVLLVLCIGLIELAGLTYLVFWLERWSAAARLRRHRCAYESRMTSDDGNFSHTKSDTQAFSQRIRLPNIRANRSVAPLIARHAVTVRGYWLTVVVTLLVPAVFSLFPIWVLPTHEPIMIHVVGSLIFYTLLLGPPALKIDFRRDLDRIMTLRQLPMSALHVTMGQLALPIAACLAFQFLVVAVTAIVRDVDPLAIVMTLLVLIPATVVVFALENAIFLTFPQRIGQEGIEVLIRTTLVFTFKGLLFVAGVAALLAWTLSIRYGIADDYQSIVYRTGGLAIVWCIAATSLWITAAAFKRFDLSADTPA